MLHNSKSHIETKEFLVELLANEIFLTTSQLLRILGEHNRIFRKVGNGKWQLSNKVEDNSLNGSIRDIVLRKLSESDEPIHISIFLELISQLRPINEHSFIANIKAVEDNKFIFFNCSFIGSTK